MADLFFIRWWRRFLALSNDSVAKALGVAFLVTLVASILVSVAAVTLRPVLQANQQREQQARMQQMLRAMEGMSGLLSAESLANLDVRMVDLQNGTFAVGMNPAVFDQRAAARDPALSIALPPEADVAGIRRRANFAPVFLLPGPKKPTLIVLPVHGVGYQSMIYAFLALEPDANTIAGLTVYDQAETPGLGARIQDPAWQALWSGKRLADESGDLRISVVRERAQGPYEVDGVSGATRTGNGVANMLHFWLGDYGFGPFLDNLKAGRLDP
jgi:Na+-transporting NADH:ubiquinone oxidoreductase subunit C